jgi:hypothetical protein
MNESEEDEKRLLDAALAEYEEDHDHGRPWREVLADLRQREPSQTDNSSYDRRARNSKRGLEP